MKFSSQNPPQVLHLLLTNLNSFIHSAQHKCKIVIICSILFYNKKRKVEEASVRITRTTTRRRFSLLSIIDSQQSVRLLKLEGRKKKTKQIEGELQTATSSSSSTSLVPTIRK